MKIKGAACLVRVFAPNLVFVADVSAALKNQKKLLNHTQATSTSI